MGFLKKLFSGKETSETDDTIQPDVCSSEALSHAAHTPAQNNLPATNLERWKASDEPLSWVHTHGDGWNHTDWLKLLSSLRNSTFWPMEEDAIGLHLEHLRDTQ